MFVIEQRATRGEKCALIAAYIQVRGKDKNSHVFSIRCYEIINLFAIAFKYVSLFS